MQKSENINELATAMSKFQGEIENVDKDKQGYQGRYSYADISSVLELVRPTLAKHNLTIWQGADIIDNKVVVKTLLAHSSGQWVSSTLSLPLEASKAGMSLAQTVGGTITYGRRYALTAMLGIAQKDDDAQEEKPQQFKPQQQHNKQQTTQTPPQQKGPAVDRVVEIGNIMRLVAETKVDLNRAVKELYHKDSLDALDTLALLNLKGKLEVKAKKLYAEASA
jgi:hypothetical protein